MSDPVDGFLLRERRVDARLSTTTGAEERFMGRQARRTRFGAYRLGALSQLVLALIMGLAACAPAPDRAEIAADMESSLLDTIRETGYHLVLTQAEFQETDEGWVWVTQFADPVESAVGSSANTEALVFMYPLETLVSAVRENDDDLKDLKDLRSFIIAFRGDSTVYELEPELMWDYADGDVDWREVTDAMLISS